MKNIKEWLGEENKLGFDIWNKKYRYREESLEEWFERVSGGDEALKQLIEERKFLFGGRVLANRGIKEGGNFYNCFSDGYVPDSMSGIMDTAKTLAITYKIQGGQGVSLSKIRPKGAGVGTEYESDGIVPFMRLFNTVTDSVSQGGARKGALMMSLDIRHKEAQTFINLKSQDGEIERANLSLEIDDEFMEAVEKYYTENERITFKEEKRYGNHIVEYEIVPIDLYKAMMENVYDWGEPGCIFTERFRNYNIMEHISEYEVVTSNPCGEQPLAAKTSCNLGSINLYEFIENPFSNLAFFDLEGFKKAVRVTIKALDDVIDANATKLPSQLEEYKENAKDYRNLGLGIFGFANALMALNIVYGSEESLMFTDKVFRNMFIAAVETSSDIAVEKGSFPSYDERVWDSEIIKNHFTEQAIDELKKKGLRNCSLLSIAPTGSIASMMGRSGGMEPEFALSYTRKTENLDDNYTIYIQTLLDFDNIVGGLEKQPPAFIASESISWKDRINIQSIIQDHIDTAISSTINLPQEATEEEIEQLYLYAWKKGLKGITIFRSGCKKLGILTTDEPNKEAADKEGRRQETISILSGLDNQIQTFNQLERGEVIEVSNNVLGRKRKLKTGCGSLHCTAFFDPETGDLMETYLSKGSTGGCNNFMVGLSRMISLSARVGADIDTIIDQLNSTGTCPSYAVRRATQKDASKGSCCPMAVGYAIKDMWEEVQEYIKCRELDNINIIKSNNGYYTTTLNDTKEPHISYCSEMACPECGAVLRFEGGCNSCPECGWSKCE